MNRRSGKKFHGESSSYYQEKEIRSYNYDRQRQPPIKPTTTSSKENVELSLEVEIADSLKKILESPKNITSRLLDVTIIRPNESETATKIETNTVAFGKNEIKDLISIIEKQKNEKKIRIDEQKQKILQKLREADKTRQIRSDLSRPRSPKTVRINREPQYIDSNGLGVNSAPPNFTNQKERPNIDFKLLAGDNSQDDYVNKIKKYRNLEDRLLELCKASKSKFQNKYDDNGPLGDQDYTANQDLDQQIYASQKTTFEDVKKRFKCTNPHKIGKPDEPCVCQHCGMLGVLVDTQKGPVMPAKTKHSSAWDEVSQNSNNSKRQCDRKSNWKDNLLSFKGLGKTPPNHNNDCIIKRIYSRLDSLEDRITIQEETTVSRDYFKSIMSKLLQSYKSALSNESQSKVPKKDTSVQCSNNNKNHQYHFKHNYKTNYCTETSSSCPQNSKNAMTGNSKISLETYSVNSAMPSEASNNNLVKSAGKKDMIVGVAEVDTSTGFKDKEDDSFWRWGEEVIKPGFDLKVKIMSLLEEKISGIKKPKPKIPEGNEAGVQVEVKEKKDDKDVQVVDNRNKYKNVELVASNKSAETDFSSLRNDIMRETGINLVPESMYKKERGILLPRKHNVTISKPKSPYPLDLRKALDDTTFKKNIEAYKLQYHWDHHVPRRSKKEKKDSDTSSNMRKSTKGRGSRSDVDIKRKKEVKITCDSATVISSGRTSCYNDAASVCKQKILKACKTLEGKKSNSKAVRVAYLNPKASIWKEESLSSGSRMSKKLSKSKVKDRRKKSTSEKIKYIQQLAKSKHVNEELLRDCITKQIRSHSHKSGDDLIKLKIPTEVYYKLKSKDEDFTEMELTLADLQGLIRKLKPKRSSSCYTISTCKLTDNRKKLQELHKQIGAILTKKSPKFGI